MLETKTIIKPETESSSYISDAIVPPKENVCTFCNFVLILAMDDKLCMNRV